MFGIVRTVMDIANESWMHSVDSGQLYSSNFQSLTNEITQRISSLFTVDGGKAQPVPDAAGKILGDAVKVHPWN